MSQVRLIDLIPPEWLSPDGKFHLIQSVYQCLFFGTEQQIAPYLSGRMDEVVYFVIDLVEGLPYENFTYEWSSIGGQTRMSVRPSSMQTPTGGHLILFTPYTGDGPAVDLEALSRLESAVGLINALEGKNACYVHWFNQHLVFPDGNTYNAGPGVLSPVSFGAPSETGHVFHQSQIASRASIRRPRRVLLWL